MEKIYENEQNEEQSFQHKKKSNLSFSVISSFMVSILAVFSLIVYGFNEVSYAAPENVFAEKINFYHYTKDGEDVSLIADHDGKFIQTPLFFSDSAFTKPLFCVEHAVDPSNTGAELSLINSSPTVGSNADPGIAYIIKNSFIKGNNMLPHSNRDAEMFATQMAIWAYLYIKYPGEAKYAFTEDQVTALVSAKRIRYRTASDYIDLYETDTSIYQAYIEPIVVEALDAYSSHAIIISESNDSITKVENGRFYQTPKISIFGDPDGEFVSYDLSLKGVEGAFAVNASNGQKIENLTNIPKGTEIYIRVPSDKITQALQELKIEVSGNFNTFYTNDYGENNNQKVISVDDATKVVIHGTEIDLVGTPDTGMSSAQTIYFIGLIVLLCGVGIVYANAKPIENN